tara:strand:- start:30 stop:1193 length:1164 start_codon:yes stop_codon:yes gene_type:complete
LDRITKNNLVSDYKKIFLQKFKSTPTIISSAPGRVNIIGEHTDYNLGLAMPMAIDKWIISMISERSDKKINVFSINYDKNIEFDFSELDNSNYLWEKYIKSAIKLISKNLTLKKGFNLLIGGNIPIGFGMSSSAALEVSILYLILSHFGYEISKYDVLKKCNELENDFIGIKSGMLDQYASIFSLKNKIMVIDFKNLTHSYYSHKINSASWVLINSKVQRNLVESKYNLRVKECTDALSIINHNSTNKYNFRTFEKKHLDLIDDMTLKKRLTHIIEENLRVKKMVKIIENGQYEKIGKLLLESHFSLSNNYDISCKEIESIISISKKHKGFFGGRIMGGGFGGCTINLIKNENKKDFLNFVSDEFYKIYKYELDSEEVIFSNGASVI